ncbi:MAG: SH3 domain-containing protein [Cognatishimia sp.]
MVRFISLSFLFLGWAFYELSGGGDFEPRKPPVSEGQIVAHTPVPDAPLDTVQTEAFTVTPVVALPTTSAEDPQITLASLSTSVPMPRQLVGTPQPTEPSEVKKLGPKKPKVTDAPALVAEPQSIVARASLSFDEPDFRRVKGTRVNMRNGPGTQYSVIGKLVRNSEVEVLQEPGNGWVKLQSIETGRIGWMSAKLLVKIAN